MKSAAGLAIILSVLAIKAGAYQIVDPMCERAVRPLGVDVPHPRLCWKLASDEPGQKQTAWRVLVAETESELAAGRGTLWDSGRLADDRTDVIYQGKALRSSQCVWWKLMSWDREGKASRWSDPQSWTMGVLTPEEWKARWIRSAGKHQNTQMRSLISVKPGLVRALVHVSGLGHYQMHINGAKVGDALFSPGWTDYRKTVLYDTFDVSGFLKEGENVIGLSLTNGMLHVERPPGRFAKFVGSYGPQRAIVHLRLEYADGGVDIFGSDETWKTHSGPITFSSIYGGEDHDARLEQSGWDAPGFDDKEWSPAVACDEPLDVLRGQSRASEPIRVMETRNPVERKTLSPDREWIDFGQNASFIPSVKVSGPAGSRIRLTGGERLLDDGSINRGTMGGAHRGSAWWEYIKATDGEETWTPSFYYLGSRYIFAEKWPAREGGALPAIDSISMRIIHSSAAPAGGFSCSDDRLNRIRDLVRWAQRSNMMSVLTDCPHREKLGWLEQNHLNGPALRYEWNMDRLAAKNVADMADALQEDGLLPNIAPEYTVFKGTYRTAAEWGASFVMVPWQQYLFSGDDSLMRKHYPELKRYVLWLRGCARNGVLVEGLGDWYDVIQEKKGRANLTPPPLTATAHLYQNSVVMARVARHLGNTEDAALFDEMAGTTRDAFLREFATADNGGKIGSGSQASIAVALGIGLLDEPQAVEARAALLDEIDKRGYFTTGAVGTRYLFQSLAEMGRSDLIHRIVVNPDVPGYAYQLKMGCTSLAESWTANLGASQNHFFLGQIIEWFYQDLAGIRPDENQPGFKQVVIRPDPIPGLTWTEAYHDGPHGRIRVRWERNDQGFKLRVGIPVNTTAVVHLPAAQGKKIEMDHPEFTRFLRRDGERAIYQTESGVHEFTVRP